MTALFLLAMTLSPSVPPVQPDASHLRRMLERLPEGARVLYVAAHPDDENTRLLAWLVQVKKLRAGYLSITRGDGGQNLIGKEQGPALGLLRTQELLAARRLDGAAQFFTSARDFGYSKSAEESLRIWGKERILEDVVFVVRTFRPEVIVTRFSPVPSETHGQHTASAQLALEAFTRAADPSYGSAELKRIEPWKARRIVWNAFQANPNEDTSRFLKMELNPYDPVLGLSMGELAGDSRSMHKSQGFGAPRRIAPTPELFQVLAGEPMKESFLDGVTSNPPRGPIRDALDKFRDDAPEVAIPALAAAYAGQETVHTVDAAPQEDIAEAIVACAGLVLSVTSDLPAVAPGMELPITVTVLQRRPAPIEVLWVTVSSREVAAPGTLKVGQLFTQKASVSDLPSPLSSDPAWLRRGPEAGWYAVDALEDRTRPEPDPPLSAEFTLRVYEQTIRVRRPIVQRWVDPVIGERTRAVDLAPPATIDAAFPALLLPDASPRPLRVAVRASAGAVAGTATVEAPDGFEIAPRELPFKLDAAGAEVELTFTVRPGPRARDGQARLALRIGDRTWDRGLRRIDHAHVPPQTWHPESRIRLVRFDLQRGRVRSVGYVPGAGDDVAEVLAQLGYDVTLLDEVALRQRDLSAFDAIVLGVRAYNVHEWLAALKPRLFDYAARGGVVVTQYNTRNFISRLPEPLGPYEMTVAQHRVTDETAEVSFAQDDAVLHVPNPIHAADFSGWVQERGLYFAEKWDGRYAAPLSMHDPGEPPLRGSLLVARYGKGRFVYTGLAFFRQLPAGVPGAARLFANLLARDADVR
ncbi:MAG TPA: PIG-L family deacetylase [Myxococcales bacterium]|nr:PIG-L family deacetylase [Myxococcales bacterium]